jgi:hypothetical protein
MAMSARRYSFTIDEMFRGNSRRALVGGSPRRSLVGRRGIGILATRSGIGASGPMKARRSSTITQDHVVDGNLSFDYTLRSDVPSTSALMINETGRVAHR